MNNHSIAPLLARVLRETFHDRDDDQPTCFELLIDLRPHEAAASPIPAARSIWQIVQHLTDSLRAARLRLLAQGPARLEPAALRPVDDDSEGAWYESLQAVQEAEARLRELLIRQDPERCSPGSPHFDASLHRELLGVLGSMREAMGQIRILRLALGLSEVAAPGPSRTPARPLTAPDES